MRHELDDDTVKLLQPVSAGEVEVDEDFEKEFAALVPGVPPSTRQTMAQVGSFIRLADLAVDHSPRCRQAQILPQRQTCIEVRCCLSFDAHSSLVPCPKPINRVLGESISTASSPGR